MHSRLKWIAILLVFAALLAGCSNVEKTQDPAADPVKITLTTNPVAPVAGKIEMVLEVKDLSGQPVTGARVDVSADHTDMSGMSMGGAATEQGNGKYAITADFSMSGNWKITVYVRKDSLDFKKDLALKIP